MSLVLSSSPDPTPKPFTLGIDFACDFWQAAKSSGVLGFSFLEGVNLQVRVHCKDELNHLSVCGLNTWGLAIFCT